MTGIEHIGKSTYQNHMDNDNCPLLTKPENDWVSLHTPKNYLAEDDDLIRFNDVGVADRQVRIFPVSISEATKYLMSMVRSVFDSGESKSVKEPPLGELIDLTFPETTHKVPCFDNQHQFSSDIDMLVSREIQIILDEMNRLEEQLKKEQWYQELSEVFYTPIEREEYLVKLREIQDLI